MFSNNRYINNYFAIYLDYSGFSRVIKAKFQEEIILSFIQIIIIINKCIVIFKSLRNLYNNDLKINKAMLNLNPRSILGGLEFGSLNFVQ